MKKIHSYLLAIATLLVFAPGLNAQDYTIKGVIGELEFPNEGDFQTESNIGFKKDISKPVDGKYWLKLEAYATGSGTQTTTSKPSDIILLLDNSSSMSQAYMSSTRLGELKKSVAKFAGSIYENAVEAKQKASDYPGNRIAIIAYNRQASLVTTSGWVTLTGDPETDNTIIHPDESTESKYAGTLITAINGITAGSGTRPDRAIRYAMSQLFNDDPANKREGANLTVLLFTDGYPTDHAGTGWGDSNQPSGDTNKFDSAFANNTLLYGSKIKQDFGAKFYTVGLITTVNAGNTWQYRNYRRVLQMMEWLSSNYPSSRWQTAAEAGVEGYNLDYEIDNPFNSASETGVHTGNDIPIPFRNLWAVSSDYNVSLDNFIAGGTNADEIDYSTIVDDNTSFDSIFEQIANQSGGSAATTFTEQSEAVDIVSSSFVLPDGATKDDIKVFTAPYLYNKTTEEFYFGTETLAPHSDDVYDDYEVVGEEKRLIEEDVDVDDEIEVTLGTDGKTISVTNFDYADNWCGPVKQGDVVVGAKGHKIIIMIPIETNPDAVGGPNIDTNAPGSGIKDKNGDLLVHFDPPAVSLPVNIHIKTTGLSVGESAKYSIKRKAGSGDWEYVTSVFVTRHSGQGEDDPIVYIKGLPSIGTNGAYTYLIVEDDWDWTYTLDSVTGIGYEGDVNISGADLETTDITTDLFMVNPITFNNSKTQGIEPKIHYSESKAMNTFGTGVGYDDYKSNGRTVITVTTTPPAEE